jgi:hypothetical protein
MVTRRPKSRHKAFNLGLDYLLQNYNNDRSLQPAFYNYKGVSDVMDVVSSNLIRPKINSNRHQTLRDRPDLVS